MSAISKTTIANVAALVLGNEPIQNITDTADEFAILANNRFDYCFGAVARMHEWSCLTKRVILSPKSDTPIFDWDYEFILPGDNLKILRVEDDQENLIKYEPAGNSIYTNYSSVYLKYIHNPTSLGQVDHLLAEAIGLYLARDLAYKIIRNAGEEARIDARFQRALILAKKEDFNEKDKNMLKPDRLMSARHGYSRIHSQYVDSRNHNYDNLTP